MTHTIHELSQIYSGTGVAKKKDRADPMVEARRLIAEVRETGLKRLDLSRNRLTALPPEIAALTKLTTLHLNDNQLTALPPEIAALSALTTLDLNDNQLTALPPEIAALTNCADHGST